MKDGKFETQAEIYQALLGGGKIKKDSFNNGTFVFLSDGVQVKQDLKKTDWSFLTPSDWSIYQEPKQKVKIVAHIRDDDCVYFCKEGSEECNRMDEECKRLSLSFDAEVM